MTGDLECRENAPLLTRVAKNTEKLPLEQTTWSGMVKCRAAANVGIHPETMGVDSTTVSGIQNSNSARHDIDVSITTEILFEGVNGPMITEIERRRGVADSSRANDERDFVCGASLATRAELDRGLVQGAE
jgi:hypothetical protein